MANFTGNKSLISPIAKRITLLLFLIQLFVQSTVIGQVDPFILEYTNVHKNTHTLNKIITLATTEGDLKRAEQQITLLNKENKLQYHIAKAYVSYNLYGKSKSHQYLEEQPLSDEWKFYCKIYLAQITKNLEDRNAYHREFNELFPHSELKLYLESKFFVDFANASIWNEDEIEQEDLLAAIEKRLTLEKEKEQLLLLELLLIDVQNDGILSTPEEEQQLTLIRLWKEYSTWMDAGYLTQLIEDCDHSDCLQMIGDIQKSDVLTAEDEVFDILQQLSNSDELKASEISQSEQLLLGLFSGEPDVTTRESLKAMAFAASNQMGQGLDGFEAMMLGRFGKLTFSETFIKQLNPLQSKDQLIEEFIQTSFYKEYTPELKTEMNQATTKELFYANGYAQYLKNWSRMFESEWGFINGPEPTLEELESWENMKPFLENNPFYYNSYNIQSGMGYPTFESTDEVETAIRVMDELLLKYPGNLAYLVTRNAILVEGWEYLKHDPDVYYRLLFESVFDLFAANQTMGSDGVDDYLISVYNESNKGTLASDESPLSPSLKNTLLEQLNQLKEKYPLNSNFQDLEEFIE